MQSGLPHPDRNPPAAPRSLVCMWSAGRPRMGTTWDSKTKGLEVTCWFLSIILRHRVNDIYSVSPFRSFSIKASQTSLRSHVYLHQFSFKCVGGVFTSNKLCTVWFSLRAHAPIKHDISCLQLGFTLLMLEWPVYHRCNLKSFKLV